MHDFLNQKGGAERVVVAMARLYEDAPIYTSLYVPDQTFEEFRSRDVRTSFLQSAPFKQSLFEALLPLYPRAFRSFDLSGFDLVISSSTHWAHHVRPKDAFHVVYCHNPPRWLYQTTEYLQAGSPAPGWTHGLLRPVLSHLRKLDQEAARGPDLYIANSQVVAERIRRVYGREAPIVNPPVDTAKFRGPQQGTSTPEPRPEGGERHYLVVGRLLPYKRIDLAIEACNRRRAPLVIVGDGPARASLSRLAGPTVRFAGKVGEEELVRLYRGAIALIQCGVEDFGIAPLEANAAGIPVAAFRNGGALETVITDVTGIFFPEQRGDELELALDKVEARTWDRTTLQAHAQRFDESSFRRQLSRVIEERMNGGSQ